MANVFGELLGTACFGLGDFQSDWLVAVVFQPLAMGAVDAALYVWQAQAPGKHAQRQARQDLYGNGFLALFIIMLHTDVPLLPGSVAVQLEYEFNC